MDKYAAKREVALILNVALALIALAAAVTEVVTWRDDQRQDSDRV